MAGGVYTLDPATGQPLVQTASGAYMPLPLSEEEMRAAGAQLQLPDVPAPPTGPDQRLAFNGPGGPQADLGGADPAMAQFIADQNQRGSIDAFRQRMGAQPAPAAPPSNTHAPPPDRFAQLDQLGQGKPQGPGGVDPRSLARPGEGAPQQGAQGAGPGGLDDPLVQQAMAEAMRGGGGGGPRRMGVTGETRKLKTSEFAMDPALAAEAQQAQLASEGYNEQLAMSLQRRQQQAYEAQQNEFAMRSGQLAAAQQRYEAQQSMLRDYEAKRDSLLEEARQMKAPDQRDFWQSAGTMGKLTAALSQVFGGALQGLRGGQNPGLEMTKDVVNSWMQTRREEYDRAQSAADRADTQLGKLVQRFGSENLAMENMRAQAWEVRDAMLKSYAEKIGTPDALETYNKAMLQAEAEKAALRAKASQGAEVEIEQKLSMQGGGGGKPKTLLDMLRAGAEAKTLKDKITGEGGESGGREVSPEKVNLVNSALATVESSDEVTRLLGEMDAKNADYDDPLGGPVDALRSLAGGKYRENRQRLEQSTQVLARNLQASRKMGASDDDREQADKMAGMGKSGQERRIAAETERAAALGALQTTLASLTPQQQRDLIRQLRAKSPERAAQVEAAIGSTANFRPAASEQVVR